MSRAYTGDLDVAAVQRLEVDGKVYLPASDGQEIAGATTAQRAIKSASRLSANVLRPGSSSMFAFIRKLQLS